MEVESKFQYNLYVLKKRETYTMANQSGEDGWIFVFGNYQNFWVAQLNHKVEAFICIIILGGNRQWCRL
jgi:hypothetical protein